MGVSAADVFSAIASGGASLIGGILGYKAQKETNEQNRQIHQQDLDYNTAMTREQWERDDTAHQREVADLTAAGLSPLAALGGAPNSQALGASNPIAMQAPQIDTNSVVQSALQAASLSEEKRHNKVTEKNRSTELDIEAAKVKNQAEELKIENKRVEEQIRYQTALNNQAAADLEELIRSHKKDEELTLSAQESLELERETKRYAQEIAKATGNKDLPTKNCYTLEHYKLELVVRSHAYAKLIEELKETQVAHASQGSGNIGLNIAGNGGSLGSSGSYYDSSNISQRQQEMINKFNQEHPIPVYIDKSQYKYADKLFKYEY